MAGELGVGAGQVENEVEMMKLKPFRKEKKKTDTTVFFSSKNGVENIKLKPFSER